MTATKKTTNKSVKSRKKASVKKVKPKTAFRTYDSAMSYLFKNTDYEKQQKLRYNVTTFDLDRMEALLKNLGNPHNKVQMVHIAGTKGKGSTATMLGKMIEANDYRVGLYTSPHVTSLHERITVDSAMITKKQMLSLVNRIHATIEKLKKKDDCPTFFEIITAIAFMHFADEEVDVAIIETGLGGRLDSTNVISAALVGMSASPCFAMSGCSFRSRSASEAKA